MPPCLCGGQTTPVDAKSPSGQDGARLSEERGRAELNQCGLHRPPRPHLQPCRAAGVSPGSPSARSRHSATGWTPMEASPSRCLLCHLRCLGRGTATRGPEARHCSRSQRTPPSSYSSPHTRTGLSSTFFSVSRADPMLSILPTQTRSLLPVTSTASSSYPGYRGTGSHRVRFIPVAP